MGKVQLKDRIISRILEIDDMDFLKAMDLLTKDKSREKVYALSDAQKERVLQARKEKEEGRILSNKAFNEKISTWLNTK
jgi:hypothetical protein